MDENPLGLSVIKAHLDLFDVEDHEEDHIPAVIGAGRKVYGIPGEPDLIHLRREVLLGARAIQTATGITPHWYRDATAEYDPQAIREIEKLGYKIAGFSVNADIGATAKEIDIEKRLENVKSGDVIIAHMNKLLLIRRRDYLSDWHIYLKLVSSSPDWIKSISEKYEIRSTRDPTGWMVANCRKQQRS